MCSTASASCPQTSRLWRNPLVQRVFGGSEDWKATIRERLQLAASMDETLRGMWLRNQELARQHHQELHAIQFAKMVADENFAHLI